MITIIGGELLSALGTGSAKINALRRGRANIGRVGVKMGSDLLSCPCYLIDDTPRLGDPAIIGEYLDRVVGSLLQKFDLAPAALARAGIFLGSSSIDHALGRAIEAAVVGQPLSHEKPERISAADALNGLMRRFGFQGPSLTYNTACTSSANALMDAATMLESKVIDHALVLGLEISTPVTMEGFTVMQLLSSEAVRPFAQNRDGMALGEAVSCVLLSRDEVMASSWRYLGGSSCCETYSVTGSDPGGRGIAKVMDAALRETGIAAKDITGVKAHGTGGEQMDLAEMRGMEKVFAELPPYFSLKPYIGHTLGGCGVAELLLTMECVDAGFLPPTLNCEILDSEFHQPPIRSLMAMSSGRFMLNYFGFGGNNTSFIMEKITW